MRLSLIAIFFWMALPTSRAAATPLINEVLYDAVGSDGPFAFTELLGTPGDSLNGWSLAGVNGSSGDVYRIVELQGFFPPDGIFVVATSAATLGLAGVRDWIGSVDWQNGPDAVQLWNPAGALIDALQYGDAGRFNAGEGAPAEDAVAGAALVRIGGDSNDNARDFRPSEPNPGRTKSSLPAPATSALLLTGIAVLRRGRSKPNRRRRTCGTEDLP